MRYARNTHVPVDRSRAALQRTVEAYGGDQYTFGCDNAAGKALIGFKFDKYRVRIDLPIPRKETYSSETRYQADLRQAYRVFLLVLKAKLESVDAGIQTFEKEFFPHLLMENGSTVYENVIGAPKFKLLSDGGIQ